VSELRREQIRLKANYMIIFMGAEEFLILRECDKLQQSEHKAHSIIVGGKYAVNEKFMI